MSPTSLGRFPSVLSLLLALSACSTVRGPETRTKFASPDQLIVDKEEMFAAIVKVNRAENQWIILEDGDHLPLIVSNAEMSEVLSGAPSWKVGSSQAVTQYDYTELISDPISPPVIEGHRYLLWAAPAPTDGEATFPTPWVAHPRGFLLIRGEGRDEFVYWRQKSYSVHAIRDALKTGKRLPLDQIIDPVLRLNVGQERLRRGDLGDEAAFIEGLLVNVRDPIGQAKNVEGPVKTDTQSASADLAQGARHPHAIWYESLALLRDVGKDEKRRKAVVAALTPLAATGRPQVRLAVALALVDLGSDVGRETLLKGFEKDSGEVSSDTDDQMTFPGRYPYDSSSVTASAHALARLGDPRGLNHPQPEVRMATAEALRDHLTPEARGVLLHLAKDDEREIQKLRASGELTKPRGPGDYSGRFPANWVRARSLLARSGDNESLRMLVDAYIADAATYPKQEVPLVPRGQMTSWGGASLPAAIHSADAEPAQLLKRLQSLFGNDPRWNGAALKGLRDAIAESPVARPKPSPAPTPTEAQIQRLLADSDPNRRAEGLAAAGYHQLMGLYDGVVEAAIKGKGVERNAAIYGLGLYKRDAPEATLRQLVQDTDLGIRSSAFELATRRDPGRFAPEGMALLRAVLQRSRNGKGQDFDQQRELAYMPRLLCRMTRRAIPSPLLDGLSDSDVEVRKIVIETLRLGGNPEAVKAIEPLSRNSDVSIATAASVALRGLGPPRD
jgi:HEAT repeat protein